MKAILMQFFADTDSAVNEANTLRSLDHPNIIRMMGDTLVSSHHQSIVFVPFEVAEFGNLAHFFGTPEGQSISSLVIPPPPFLYSRSYHPPH